MANYIEIIIEEPDAARRDWLLGELDAFGFNGFEEAGDVIKAYAPEGAFEQGGLEMFSKEHQLTFTQQVLADQNWNQQWESSFEPVVIGDFCTVRAGFHAPSTDTKYEIIVTPKMSFGTGHHATTYMMINQMSQLNFVGKQVIDFGTGTGVLAILAEKLGATSVSGLDNDTWSITNAEENVEQNDCHNISLLLMETLTADWFADIILANINRHVLLQHMAAFCSVLTGKGLLLLSGILQEDAPVMVAAAEQHGFQLIRQQQRGNWLSMLWQKV